MKRDLGEINIQKKPRHAALFLAQQPLKSDAVLRLC